MSTFLTVLLAPVLLPQGLRVKRDTPRLPVAAGPVSGIRPGAQPRLRLLVLGESTVDGGGARDHEEALTGRLAESLAAATGREIAWRAVGRTGANARRVHDELLDDACAEPADLVVVVLGVNDTIELHSPARFRRDMLRLVGALRRRLGEVPILLSGVPPMDRFPVLPRPLRDVLGLRSRALDIALAELAKLPSVSHVPSPVEAMTDAMFATDGFHPGPAGYRLWADHLSRSVDLPA